MARFIGSKDILLFKNISELLIHHVINTNILFYKLDINTVLNNVYGLSRQRIYRDPVEIPCLILHNPQNLEFSNIILYKNNALFKILKSTLEEVNLYPQIGDIISWRELFWLVNLVRSLQLVGGRTHLLWCLVCQTNIISQSKLQQISKPSSNTRRVIRKIENL